MHHLKDRGLISNNDLNDQQDQNPTEQNID